MKFVPLFDEVTSALNFNTPDCRVVGGCDLYTTKAAGSDKKLYRDIECYLNTQYTSLLRYSASISVPKKRLSPTTLSQPSPFGSLSQISSRRIFAYLIATLNASHPDYDFSHVLSPTDFRKERSLDSVIQNVDSNLNVLSLPVSDRIPHDISQTVDVTASQSITKSWSPHIWSIIDSQMGLRNCTIYCWAPLDEPFDGDEISLWSLNYFFFNKELKRVAYLYVRAIPNTPAMSHRPSYCVELYKQAANEFFLNTKKRKTHLLGEQMSSSRDNDDDDDHL